MKKIMKSLLIGLLLMPLLGVQAQSKLDNKVLMTIGDTKITAKEFMDVYNKNNVNTEVIEKKSIEEYLDLFVNFRLKVLEAENLHMDTSKAFRKELDGYRKQLAKPYFTNDEINDELVREAYDRKCQDVKASHILITVDKHALPADTLKAYNKAIKLRSRILAGEDFEAVAVEASDDPSARDQAAVKDKSPFRKGNKGALGYFTVFDMVYPFETGAYETPVGQVSMPIRSDFGYHLIRVDERSQALGTIQAAHIFLALPADASEEDTKRMEEKANNIYKEIQEGKDFREAVTAYSDDRGTISKGGMLSPFAVSRIVPEFITAVKTLKDGEIASPVRSIYGFHIIKRINAKGVGDFESEKDAIKERIQKDDRSKKSETLVVSQIKKEAPFKEFPKKLDAFLNTLDSTIISGAFILSETAKPSEVLFKYGKKDYTVNDFAAFITKKQTKQEANSIPSIYGNKLYQEFVETLAIEYEDSILEEKYPDFKRLINEYRDGIMLFDLMDKQVWSKALIDTVGLEKFYEANKDNYMWNDRVDAMVFTITRQESIEKMLPLIMQDLTAEEYKLGMEKDTIRNVNIMRRSFEKGDNPIIDKIEWKVGVQGPISSTVDKNTVYVKVMEVLKPTNKTIKEARGLITSDYQNFLEKEWIEQLRDNYPVVINQKVLDALIAEN